MKPIMQNGSKTPERQYGDYNREKQAVNGTNTGDANPEFIP